MASKPKKLPSGNWNTQVYLPNGRRKSITDPLKRVVEQRARDLEASFAHGGGVVTDHRLTIDRWAVRWFRARRVDPNTAAKNDSHWRNHIQPYWAAWPLTSIDRLDVQTWVNGMADAGVGAPTISAAYNLLSGMLSDAVLSKKIVASPCVEVDLPKVVKPAPRWLTREEYDRIQLALDGQLAWQAYVGLACFSGLRPGELAGLDVEHLDFDRSLVRVQQVQTRHGLRAYPKSDTSQRTVPFPPEVRSLLWRLVGDVGQGAVFPWRDGGRVDDRAWLRQVWRPALERAGIAYVRPYVTRHTAASWLVQAGVPPIEIVRMLGHSSMALVNTYLHLAPDQHDRIRLAWDDSSALPTYDARPTSETPHLT